MTPAIPNIAISKKVHAMLTIRMVDAMMILQQAASFGVSQDTLNLRVIYCLVYAPPRVPCSLCDSVSCLSVSSISVMNTLPRLELSMDASRTFFSPKLRLEGSGGHLL